MGEALSAPRMVWGTGVGLRGGREGYPIPPLVSAKGLDVVKLRQRRLTVCLTYHQNIANLPQALTDDLYVEGL